MKVLWITSQSDTLNSIRPEAETLIGLANAGVTCEIMTQGDSVYRQTMEAVGIRVIDFVPRHKFSSAAATTIRRALTEGRHDVLHLFNNKAIANGVRAARGLPVKVVSYRGQTGNVHRYDPICWLTHLSPRIDRVVCVSESVRRDLAKRRLDPDSCITIHKGHDLGWYTEQPADLQAEFAIPEQDFVICAVANYRPRKGLEVLVAAMKHLPEGASVWLLLVGSGLAAPRLTRAILASPCRDRIHVVGFRQDACRLIAASDCSVLPSLRREGLPKAVIEAMAYGVPPVVTDTGGSPELVVDGDCGRVVPPGDPQALARAIGQMIENRGDTRRMGDRARQRIDACFNIRQTIDKTLEMYRNLIIN
ncbi:MAG: glycosyltransferase [Chromatiales bacterium]|nr:glycosyltransferase [Chromatiales bacterium]